MMWGSAMEISHVRDVVPIPGAHRRKCYQGRRGNECQRKATHYGRANGVALVSGCEFHCYMWRRDPFWSFRPPLAQPESR